MNAYDTELKLPSGEAVRAYSNRPEGAPHAPGVVVVHEAWGVDKHIRSVVDRLAKAGFSAIAPDLLGMDVTIAPATFLKFYGALLQLPAQERAVPEKVATVLATLEPQDRGQVQQLMGIVSKGPTPEGLAGIDAAIAELKAKGARKVAVMGFCMGGGYTWAHAYAGGAAEAYSPWYGRMPKDADPKEVKAPIEGHFGGADQGIPVEPLEQAATALRALGKHAVVHVYPDAPHAFFNETRDTYREDAAGTAWKRTLAFFERELKG